MENALVHPVSNVDALTEHFTLMHNDRALLEKLRAASLATANELTWAAAGRKMGEEYRSILANRNQT